MAKPVPMDMLRSILGGAQAMKFPFAKEFSLVRTKEFKLFSLFLFLLAISLPLSTYYLAALPLSSIRPFLGFGDRTHELKKTEKLNIQDIVAKTRSYDYGDTQLGFYLKDLNFFDINSKLDAEKKILDSLPKTLSKKAKVYLRAVLKMSQKHQVDPIWILSVMWTESNFDFTAKSWAGARGLMQIMPATRKFVYNVYKKNGNKLLVEQDSFNIDEYFPYKVPKNLSKRHLNKLINIELGIIYLKTLLGSFKNHKHATVAYNMGPGWTRGRLRRNLPVGQKNEYLDKVRKAYKSIVKKI